MKQAFNFAIMAITIVAVVWVALNFSNTSPYRRPQSAAEKALDTTLQKLGDDAYDLENTHIRPGVVPKSKQANYSSMLTAKLMAKLAADEKRMVEQECNDIYAIGENCGFDYDPILCTQDTDPAYVYRTTHQDMKSASIDYSWPMSAGRREETVAHYTLVKDADNWKIDSVSCTFN